MKKWLALILAVALMAALSVPAMAAYDPCDPSLNPDTGGSNIGCPGTGGGTTTPPTTPGGSGGTGSGTPGTAGGSEDDDKRLAPTDNIANEEETLEALSAGETVEVKLYNDTAALAPDTMDLLGSSKGTLVAKVGKMTVTLPGGFGKVSEPGRVYYPLDFIDNAPLAGDLAAAVKGEKAKTEVFKAGGEMVLPGTATVTIKTRLEGMVKVYRYSEETGRYALLASPEAKDGSVTFATKALGFWC